MGGDVFRDEFSLAFDGTDDYIQIPSTTFNIHNSTHSFAFWVKRSAIDSWDIVLGNSAHSNYDFIIFDTDGGDRLIIEGPDGDSAVGDCSVVANRWYHFVVVSNGDESISMYQDGNSINMSNNSVTAAMTIDNIGGSKAGNHLTGSISEIAIYNTALTASQVKTLYNGREPYNHKEGIASSNLTHWYRMGDGKFDSTSITSRPLGIVNSDIKTYLITDEVTPTLSSEKYTATNALANLNNAQAQTDIDQVYEGGSQITSGTAQTDAGLSVGRYAMHIQSSSNEDRFSVNLDDYLTKGKVYILSCVAKHSGSGDDAFLKITDSGNLDASGDSVLIETLGTSETGWAYYGFVFEHTSATGDQGSTEWFGAREGGGSNNAEFWVSELSIKEVGGTAGVMTNMSINDFEGDTP
tara:strand:- start:320 stop:1546 length:1227 start_codon:yes stop_codon:yes gene_type:complete